MNKNTNIGSGLGLDSIGDLSSLLNENPQNVAKQTGPLLLHIDQVVEDPDQPRPRLQLAVPRPLPAGRAARGGEP